MHDQSGREDEPEDHDGKAGDTVSKAAYEEHVEKEGRGEQGQERV